MCIICCSAAGVRQPKEETLRRMFLANPDGAGYMTARNGRVEISKGFMTWEEFARAIRSEAFTAADPVVYHFRIATQAGVTPAMTHPFPLTNSIANCKLLDVGCPIGVAHNGVIPLTSDPTDKEYSDTAHFIAEYLAYIVTAPEDLRDPDALAEIAALSRSKWALLGGDGHIATVGDFIEEDGILFSNGTFRLARPYGRDLYRFRFEPAV